MLAFIVGGLMVLISLSLGLIIGAGTGAIVQRKANEGDWPKGKIEVVGELTEAIRYTVEYVGTNTLPPLDGWSWWDAMRKYAPDKAEEMLRAHNRRNMEEPHA